MNSSRLTLGKVRDTLRGPYELPVPRAFPLSLVVLREPFTSLLRLPSRGNVHRLERKVSVSVLRQGCARCIATHKRSA